MSHVDELHQAAREAILRAFPDEPVPAPELVRNDHCPECTELASRFSGRAWPQITSGDLSSNPCASLLTPAAFRYYLPAMMLLTMEDPQRLDCFPASLVGALSPPGGKPSDKLKACVAELTPEQVLAIAAFLRHQRARLLDEEPDDDVALRVVERALKYVTSLEPR